MAKKKKEESEVAKEFLKVLPGFLASTGGSLLLFLLLLPFVVNQLTKSLPQLAGVLAGLAQAIRDPAATANDLGELGADTLLAVPTGFFGGLVAAGFGIGQDILGSFGIGPTTPADDRELTYCERLGNDLVLIKRKLDKSSGVAKIQGTFAYAGKLYDIKSAGCEKPGFINQSDWDRVPG